MKRTYSANPLGYGNGPSRFSPLPPPAGQPPTFGVVYGAADLATAAWETLIRHRLDIDPGRTLLPADYAGYDAVNFSTLPGRPLNLLDLTRGNAIRFGVPTDVLRYSVHTDGQHFSEFVHQAMSSVDGFLYSSRLTERLCVAVYDRSLAKLAPGPAPLRLSRPILQQTLHPWNVWVV